jgi:hypothetical protein
LNKFLSAATIQLLHKELKEIENIDINVDAMEDAQFGGVVNRITCITKRMPS